MHPIDRITPQELIELVGRIHNSPENYSRGFTALELHAVPLIQSLTAERDTAQARVKELEAALSRLIDVAQACDGWESFPPAALHDANKALAGAAR